MRRDLLRPTSAAMLPRPPIDSEWVSRHHPEVGIYRVLEIRPARRGIRRQTLVGPDVICGRGDRTVIVPVRAFQPGGPFIQHSRQETTE